MAIYNKTELYFFKFPSTFFEKDEIETIENDSDSEGDSTIVLYLKLINLAMNKGGYLGKIILGELIPYTGQELCKKTNLQLEDFERRLKKLIDVGLIKIKDNMFYIEEALNFTNQTVGAKKKEIQRKNREDKCPPDIDLEQEIEQDIEVRNNNIEKDLEINSDNSSLTLYCAFQEYIEKKFNRTLSINEIELLEELISQYPKKELKLCIDEASRRNKLSIGYIKGILENRDDWGQTEYD
jgi:predicted phage replisome organizer